jgi:hypothetical protein
MRTDSQFRAIFEKAGFQIMVDQLQKGMPEELFPIKIYVLMKDPKFVNVENHSNHL